MKQVTIIIEDKVGKLAKVLNVLAENKVNIEGISTERGPISEVRLIVEDPATTHTLLESSGFVVHLTEVLAISLEDAPGTLSGIATRLAQNNVSIEYIYRTGSTNGAAKLIMSTSEDAETVRKHLKEFKIS